MHSAAFDQCDFVNPCFPGDGSQSSACPTTADRHDGSGAELLFEFGSHGKASGTIVSARLGGDVIACDRFDLAKAKARAQFVDSLCKETPDIDRAEAERVLCARAAEHTKQVAEAEENSALPDSEELLLKMPEPVRVEAHAMLESPDLMERIIDDVASCGVAGERDLVASVYLVGVSRLLQRPLAAIVQAPSSTGKSYVVEKTVALFPKETVIEASDITRQALYYTEEDVLRHKFVAAGERSRCNDDEAAEATRALREIIGSGRLSKLVPTKENGQFVTKRIERTGPIAYIETTSQTRIFNEDENRCLLLSADERSTQTANIVKRLAADYCRGRTASTDNAVVERHVAMQRMLQQRPVVVPFAEQIAGHFHTERVEARRAFPHLMSMIQASALLHQFQRQIEGDMIVADWSDYELARRLCRGPLARLLSGRISDASLHFHDRLVRWATDKFFTTTEAAKLDRKEPQTVRDYLRELADAGAVEQIEPSRGCKPATWRLTGMSREELVTSGGDLPPVQDLQDSYKVSGHLAQPLGNHRCKTAVQGESFGKVDAAPTMATEFEADGRELPPADDAATDSPCPLSAATGVIPRVTGPWDGSGNPDDDIPDFSRPSGTV